MRPLLAGLALALAAASSQAQSRLVFARFELTGPMSEPEVTLTEGSSTELTGSLLPGEWLEKLIPLAVSPEHARGDPRWRWTQDPDRQGRARFLGWVEGFDQEWARLPAGLRARPRPPVEPAARAPSPFLACLLAGLALAAAAAQRRSRWGAAALSLVGCAAAWFFVRGSAGEPDGPRVLLEGQSTSSDWIEVRGAWERLTLPAESANFVLTTQPVAAPLHLRLPLASAGALEIRARETGLFAARKSEREWGSLTPQDQSCADFAAVWWREDGEWTYRGAWRRGEPLPAPRAGPAPPGWLASGLPQGPRVALARAEAQGELWFRQLGP